MAELSSRAYPEVFTKPPHPQTEKKEGQLTPEQINQFFEEGYCIVENYFTAEELQPCRDAVEDLVEDLAQELYQAGKIKSLYREFGLFQRLTELDRAFPGANILLYKRGKLPKAFMDLWCCDKLVNMTEQILGPDVAGHPVWNLRVKTPRNDATTVPWHQDSAYFSADSQDHMIVIAWIPFLDTNKHNGGMQVVKRGQRAGKVGKHTCCHADTFYIMLPEEEMEKTLGVNMKEDVVTCNVPYGGFLLFNNLTPHRSLPNFSNDVRWSLDLRWQSPHENWGFYDMQEGILFKTKDNARVQPDWKKYLSVNRKEEWQRRHNPEGRSDSEESEDKFSTIVTGPWIGRWEVVNHNRHTKAFSNF